MGKKSIFFHIFVERSKWNNLYKVPLWWSPVWYNFFPFVLFSLFVPFFISSSLSCFPISSQKLLILLFPIPLALHSLYYLHLSTFNNCLLTKSFLKQRDVICFSLEGIVYNTNNLNNEILTFSWTQWNTVFLRTCFFPVMKP